MSQHILHGRTEDEVLWYRTNVCFGRLLEFLGQFDRAFHAGGTAGEHDA